MSRAVRRGDPSREWRPGPRLAGRPSPVKSPTVITASYAAGSCWFPAGRSPGRREGGGLFEVGQADAFQIHAEKTAPSSDAVMAGDAVVFPGTPRWSRRRGRGSTAPLTLTARAN